MSEENYTSSWHAIERRVDRRILVNIPVEISEVDGKRQPSMERTLIEDVSDFGCRFSTRGPVKQGGTVAVKIVGNYGNDLPDEAPRLYEIIWVAPKDHGSTVGARLLQGEKPANAKFPPENGGQNRDLK